VRKGRKSGKIKSWEVGQSGICPSVHFCLQLTSNDLGDSAKEAHCTPIDMSVNQ